MRVLKVVQKPARAAALGDAFCEEDARTHAPQECMQECAPPNPVARRLRLSSSSSSILNARGS